MPFRAVFLLALLLTACGDEGSALSVDLRTDFVAGVELAEVDLTLLSPDALDRVESYTVRPDAPLLSGVRVARFEELAPGAYTLRARLFGPDGGRLLERRVNVNVRGETVTTVPVTRACLNVTCDEAGATECLNGMCVPPGCTEETPELCGTTLCREAADCPASTAACAAPACAEGACFLVPIEDACASGEFCVPDVGCVTRPDAGDAGAGDAGRDAGDSSTCAEGVACDTGTACESGRTDCSSGSPVCVSTGVREAGVVCRAASSECDLDEMCDGTAPTCPEDVLADTGTPCTAGFCNAGACGGCEPGVACATGNACELGTVRCEGDTPVCEGSGFRDAGTVCRPAAGPCDLEEVCTGAGASCPSDARAPSSTVCRDAAGACDTAENCTGSSDACPADRFRSGNICRVSSGACDVADTCSGSSAVCPADQFRPSSFVCRDGGLCDPEETCSGSSASCPPDTFTSAGTYCGAPTCDGFGPCMGTDCGADRGIMSRNCTPRECNGSGSCVTGSVYSPTQACTLPSGSSCAACGGSGCGAPLSICDGRCNAVGCCNPI